jgi:rhodanese-related sulfurtransferase
MPIYPVTAPAGVRRALLAKKEIALLDVRLESQFAQGHALLVLADDGAGRAAMTGSWLAQMGWDVLVAALPADAETGRAAGARRPARPPAPPVPLTVPSALAGWLSAGRTAVVDLESSKLFRAGHVPGAAWALRADLADPALLSRLGSPEQVVLTSTDGYLAAWAAADLGAYRAGAVQATAQGNGTEPFGIFVLAGGTQGWAQSGRLLESGDGRMLSSATDVYRRPYEGTGVDPAAMQAYLDWEYGLVAQLERDGTHGFRVLAGGNGGGAGRAAGTSVR